MQRAQSSSLSILTGILKTVGTPPDKNRTFAGKESSTIKRPERLCPSNLQSAYKQVERENEERVRRAANRNPQKEEQDSARQTLYPLLALAGIIGIGLIRALFKRR
jgi:hypothetical protein